MENVKKDIPSAKVDEFFKKEFGSLPKDTPLPSEIFNSSSSPIEVRFMEISSKCYGKSLARYNAGTMVCRFEMFL